MASVAAVALEDDGAVVAAEADVVAHGVADLLLTRVTSHDVEVDLGIRLEVVLCGRDDLVVHRERGEHAFDGAGCTLAELEQKAILAALKRCDGDKRRAAEELGISRAKIYQRLKEWEGLAS